MSTEIQERKSNRSGSIAALAAALAKAQGEMSGASKGNENPYFKSKYADLASVWDACRVALSQNGLSVAQVTDDALDTGRVAVETVLMHASGEWISSRMSMRPVKDDPQGIGSCLTYIRRYALSAIVGVAPEDDDGNAASGKQGSGVTEQPRKFVKPEPKETPMPKLAQEIYITPKQAQDFAMRFRDSLPADMQGNADTIRHDWLFREGYVDSENNPSSKCIPVSKFIEAGKKAVAFAKGL